MAKTRLGKRERAKLREVRQYVEHDCAKRSTDFSFKIHTSTMRARYWENYSGKVCQNIKGTIAKPRPSDCIFDKCQSAKS